MASRLALAGAVACALVLALWFAGRSPEAPEYAPDVPAHAPSGSVLPALDEPPAPALPAPVAYEQREEAPSEDQPGPLPARQPAECAVTVIVSTGDGKPLPEALVRLTGWRAGQFADTGNEEGLTDTGGFVRFPSVLSRVYALTVSLGEELLAFRLAKIRPAATRLDVVVELTGARIRGSVTTTAGSPARTAYVAVHLIPTDPSSISEHAGIAFVDERGCYSTAPLAHATYSVSLRRRTDHCYLSDAMYVTLESTDVWRVDFVVPDEGGVTGRVTDPGGRGLPAEIEFRLEGAHTDPWVIHSAEGTGAYALSGALAGVYDMVVRAPCHRVAFRRWTLVAGQTIQVDVQLQRGGRISGVVRSTRSAALKGRVVLIDGPGGIDLSSCDIGPDGRFVLDHMALGSCFLCVEPEDHAWQYAEVLLSEEAPEALVTVDAEEGGRLVGQVLVSGAAIDSVIVTFTGSLGGPHGVSADVAPDGAFVVGHVPAGTADVLVRGPDGLSGAARLTFRNGEDTAWAFQLAGPR
ncbi:MAG: carboxypeptidase regulatory-like domain-containing protein [Planctomycetes bacterium]|nr:carboxypeptidase regulatory-like domain-containing protein [Planctomycetota bacterium]